MNDVMQALARAFSSLAHPKMLLLMIWPLAVALAIWTVFGVLFGAQVWDALRLQLTTTGLYQSWSVSFPWLSAVTTGLLAFLMFLLFVPLVLITATLIISIVSMPMMIKHVSTRLYPSLARRGAGAMSGVAGGAWNAVVALLGLIGLAILTLPLWLIPPLWPAIPVFLIGYFNQRVFRYDALSEHADLAEIKTIVRANARRLWALGILLALLAHIPILGFFLPVVGGLAFIHFGLARLADLRANSVSAISTTATP